MAIWMAGIDHNRAELDVRSRFSLTRTRMMDACARIRQAPELAGGVLISTCNRFEIWLDTADDAPASPVEWICAFLGEDPRAAAPWFVVREGYAAVEHLFRVAAGLESKIVGEDQIVTQVNEAAALARECGASNHSLEVLFRMAVTAGRRVKAEADLTARDPSAIHTAMRALEERGFCAGGRRCMVIGSGMMGKIAAEVLLERGAEVCVTVRKYRNGIVDIPEACARIDYDDRLAVLPECDLVVSATRCPNYTLQREELAKLNVDHPVCLIDLAVPRDIDPGARELPWATLYDIDSFHIDLQTEESAANLRRAMEILEEEQRRFRQWYEGRDLVPKIQRLKGMAAANVTARMAPFFRRATMTEAEHAALEREIEGASARMMNHLLFGMQGKLEDQILDECLNAMEESLTAWKHN